MAITLTEPAARHVSRYLTKRGQGVGVRLGVKTTGCSGMAYKLEYVDEIGPEDMVFEGFGVKVLVDPKSFAYLDGTELDFVREGLNEGFKFNNPKERDRCGCGESFPRVNLQSNDFELFALEQRFQQDRAVLDLRWKDLQRQVHPDKFADQGAAAQRIAMQWSVRINEAYQRLKDPLKRAAYLCELHGAPVNAENNTAMPAAFLMQQMEWREALDDAHSAEDLEKISLQCKQAVREVLQKIEQLLDQSKDYTAAVAQVRALMFIERFTADVNARLDQLDL